MSEFINKLDNEEICELFTCSVLNEVNSHFDDDLQIESFELDFDKSTGKYELKIIWEEI